MDLKEKTAQIVELMKNTKTSWVATDPESTDLGIYLHFYRGDDMVATVQCPLDRDTALRAGQIGAMGFNADTMAITFESYHSELPESPITGKPWKHHEMQYVAEAYPEARERGWVNECLTTTAHMRGGGYAMYSQAYLIKENQMVWQEGERNVIEIDSEKESDHGGGVMFDYLQSAMSGPTMDEKIAQEAETNKIAALMTSLVDDPEARKFHTDMATFKALTEQELATGVMLSAEKGSNREQWLEERFGPPDREA